MHLVMERLLVLHVLLVPLLAKLVRHCCGIVKLVVQGIFLLQYHPRLVQHVLRVLSQLSQHLLV